MTVAGLEVATLFLTNSHRFAAILRAFVGLTTCLSLKTAAQIDTHLQPTNPKSVQSLSYAGATAVPIDDLYYTRSIGGTSWSPDGKEIVLATNLSGRTNLWKVSVTGSWPIQLSQSEDAQNSLPLTRPMVSGSVPERIKAAISHTTFSQSRLASGIVLST